MNQNIDPTIRYYLPELATAVTDLVDAMGGGEWELDRADEIADSLRWIARGRLPEPIQPHYAEHGAWTRNRARETDVRDDIDPLEASMMRDDIDQGDEK